MDALSDVTATESELLVDDSSNGLSDSSSRTAQSSTVAEIQLNDATSDNSLSYHAMSSVDKMNRKAEDSTTYSSDPKISNYENPTANEGENLSADEAEDLSPNDVDYLSTKTLIWMNLKSQMIRQHDSSQCEF